MPVNLDRLQQDFITRLPLEIPIKAAQGFIATAALNVFYGFNVQYALLGGSLAAMATCIEAVTRPIIKGIFPEQPVIALAIQITIPKTIALAFATSIAPWVGISYKMTSIILPVIAWIALNENFYKKNVAMVEIL